MRRSRPPGSDGRRRRAVAGVAAIENAPEHRMSVAYDDVLRWIRKFAAEVEANKEYLTQLDAQAGDQDVGALLKTVGMTLVSTVGGAGGPLYGTLFLQMGTAASGKGELGPDDWAAALEAGIKGVEARGKAEPGDKTMIDALLPGLEALRS